MLEWPRPAATSGRCSRSSTPTGTSANWGEITEQDYDEPRQRAAGDAVGGFDGARLEPTQEGNVLHMHRVIDDYLTAAG